MMTMKKPVLAVLGLGAACAACCAAPVALSLVAGLGFAGFGLAGLGAASFGWIAGGAGAVLILLGLAAFYLLRRRQQQALSCTSDRSCGCA
jgi:hypothetical protein